MAGLKEGQIITFMIDEVIETVTNMTPLAQAIGYLNPAAQDMQRSSNELWLPVEQEAPTQKGWDLTGQATGILELAVKCNMGEPDNDFFTLRADDVRDERSLRRRTNASAKKLANNVETSILQQGVDLGSLVVSSATPIGTSKTGWDFVSEAEEVMFSRELNRDSGISFVFNPKDYRGAGYDLTQRDIYGRIAEDAYKTGTIQSQVAGFNNVLRHPKMPSLVGSAVTGVTVAGAQSFKPEAWTLGIDGNKQNVDNRTAVVAVSSGVGFKRGDKISFTGVKFLSQMAKNVLTHDATFSVVAVDGNNLTITPKPIALSDVTLTPEQKAYANVNTTLAAGMAINLLNTTTAQTNIFMADDAIKLVSQPIPINHQLFSGMKTQSFNIPGVGINGVIAYQGNISTFAGLCRIALWYAPTAIRPESIGVGLANQA
ncbi:P22 phage major capsid protein family protein [Serratia sp. UGAL515B_01]|uniref:P22 phage major capsid protein family protein n=1 Tax=Serratia sp. UGAL515B_01 TaxID=2986763 RepID=UPI002953020D|nr:P22 phage major capsid protein family protein [Serratia sp. UGAL515B_01]WON77577.1 coat protein [Serratia sp. UGAL515B_01]